MKVQLSNPRVLHDGSQGSGKHYAKGQHEISEATADHWFTQELMKSGDITVLAEPKAAKPEPKDEDSDAEESDSDAEEQDSSGEDQPASSQPQRRKRQRG